MIRLNHYNRLPQKLPVAPIKLPVTRSQSLPSETPQNSPQIDTPEEVPATPMTQRSKSTPKGKGRPKKTSSNVSNIEASAVDTHDHQQDLEQL